MSSIFAIQLFEAFVPAGSLPAVVTVVKLERYHTVVPGKSRLPVYHEITVPPASQEPEPPALRCRSVTVAGYKPKRLTRWVRRRIAIAYGVTVSVDDNDEILR